ncbi:hypothetical protein GCM10010302_26780 [Streptomyces polychromogenes]|uniref:Uncharacterized protein n=1 Tax=Streptomyces polychromogenes TaxID=67342 RepID=A0ABP3F2M7_9ACTN
MKQHYQEPGGGPGEAAGAFAVREKAARRPLKRRARSRRIAAGGPQRDLLGRRSNTGPAHAKRKAPTVREHDRGDRTPYAAGRTT